MIIFFMFDGVILMVLMVFCIVCFIDGVQGKDEFGCKYQSLLDGVENVIQFDFCDWWKLMVDNFFLYMKLLYIVQVFFQIGLVGVVQDVVKMKKKDVVEYVEYFFLKICWVLEWMISVDNQKQFVVKFEFSLVISQNDIDVDVGDCY